MILYFKILNLEIMFIFNNTITLVERDSLPFHTINESVRNVSIQNSRVSKYFGVLQIFRFFLSLVYCMMANLLAVSMMN
jgi:hypothetical protein